MEVSAGQFGGAPAVEGQRLNASIIVQNLLKTPEEFAAIPLRTNPDGSIVRVRDVGRTELGTERYETQTLFNGKPAAALAIRQAAGANALDTADAVKAKMEELSRYFPPGMKVIYPYDTTPFVKVAIDEVVKTLFEAILLVFLVMYLFLGNIRATLIPTLAVPVVILGTFAVLGLFGFSINMLTMFAMVLAIGLLVDDAIVVVENVERVMAEEGLPPKEATRKSMGEITSALDRNRAGALGGVRPHGVLRRLHRRHLPPVFRDRHRRHAALGPGGPDPDPGSLRIAPQAGGKGAWDRRRPGFSCSGPFSGGSTGSFFGPGTGTRPWSAPFSQRSSATCSFTFCMVAALGFLFQRMPTAYLPNEDQGIMFVQAMLPAGSTLEQTEQVMEQVRSHFLEDEKEAVASCFTVAGRDFSGTGQNVGLAFIKLKDWDLRNRPDLKVDAVVGRAMRKFSKIRNARVFAFPPPAVIELGHGRRVRLSIAGPGRAGPRSLDGGPQPDARHGRTGPEADPRPPQRPGRCVPIPDRRGLGKGGRPGGSHQLHPQHHLGGIRQRLCE